MTAKSRYAISYDSLKSAALFLLVLLVLFSQYMWLLQISWSLTIDSGLFNSMDKTTAFGTLGLLCQFVLIPIAWMSMVGNLPKISQIVIEISAASIQIFLFATTYNIPIMWFNVTLYLVLSLYVSWNLWGLFNMKDYECIYSGIFS